MAWFQNKKLQDAMDLAQKVVVVLGVPIAFWNYCSDSAKEIKAREWAAYEKMDERYWRYEQLAMRYPELNVSDADASDKAMAALTTPRDQLTPGDRVHERQMMFMLIAMYERAFLLYRDQSSAFRKEQWAGWDAGMKRWVTAPGFAEAWRYLGTDFDSNFQEYVNELLRGLAPQTTREGVPVRR